MLLSICIPNFNRANCLDNCLNSIVISKKNSNLKFEVCISDNNSSDNIENVINSYKSKLNINFKKNKRNVGLGKNILNVVSMAKGEFVWILGNDDLIVPKALKSLEKLFSKKNEVDFYFVNSFNLQSFKVLDSPQPFNTENLPNNMEKFSKIDKNQIINFLDLINPKFSFDFLLGIYLSIFRKKKWDLNVNKVNEEKICREGVYSTFENTCPHVIIFSKSFSGSKAYVQAEPLSINLSGEREWSDLYTFIEAIRIPEALDVYLNAGLPTKKYYFYKNYSLKNFIPSLVKIILSGKKGGKNYIKIFPHIIKNMIFPNFYLSPFNFFYRKIFIK